MRGGDATPTWQPWTLREHLSAADPARSLERAERRYREVDSQLHCWVGREPRSSAQHVDVASNDGPLAGVPLGVKDVIDLAGHPTRCGSTLRADALPATDDADIVTAWRRAGAVPVGKTVTTEFAYFSPGPTHNPARLHHTPGGSSSGSAAAVASGQVPLALGAQTAGSVTRPAAYCGVASMVMTPGRFPGRGVVGLSPSLDAHGFLSATVADLAYAWGALVPGAGGTADTPEEALPRRILLWHPHGVGDVDGEMTAAVSLVGRLLKEGGVDVDLVPSDGLARELVDAHLTVMAFEAARERPAELASAEMLSEQLAALLRRGAALHEDEHEAALVVARNHLRSLLHIFETVDAIVGPAALGPAPAGLSATGDPVLSRPWQVLGLPTVGIPGLRTSDGLPLGLQAIGRPSGESALLSAARAVEHLVTEHVGSHPADPTRGSAAR